MTSAQQNGEAADAPTPHAVGVRGFLSQMHMHRPTVPEFASSLLKTIVIAVFLLSFVFQPFVIPSESMERTLLVGDFLLMNKQIYARAGALTQWLFPHRDVERGDIVIFHHPKPELLVKRVIGLPGDRLHIAAGHVYINGQKLDEPYAVFEPTLGNPLGDDFPVSVDLDPRVDPKWWRQMEGLTANGELRIPEGYYFLLGDNRNHSSDSREWGLVARDQIVARPLVIYFSLRRPSTTDTLAAVNDRLGHDGEDAGWKHFARWKRIFTVVH
jgi:signal peptidase I